MRKERIKAVLFDLDDTLVDHTSAIRAAVSAIYSHYSILAQKFPDEAAFQRAWIAVQDKHYPSYQRGGLTHAEQKILRLRELWQPLANLGEEDCFAIYDKFQEFYAANWQIYGDVFPCLEALFPLKLGLITNGWDNQRRKLEIEKLHEKFGIIVVSSEVGLSKPDPRIFQMACAALSVKPTEAMYVGDLYDLDVQGSSSAGMVPVWLRRTAEHLESPALLTIRSLNELAALIVDYNRRLSAG